MTLLPGVVKAWQAQGWGLQRWRPETRTWDLQYIPFGLRAACTDGTARSRKQRGAILKEVLRRSRRDSWTSA